MHRGVVGSFTGERTVNKHIMNAFETFVQLHATEKPLIIGNVWDVTSAKTFESLGYKAIATSSDALAKVYGYDDGEKMPFSDLLRMAEQIARNVSIPFSVDLEGGYSQTTDGIVENITRLYDLGVAGINFEDSLVGGKRGLRSVSDFQKTLAAVREQLLRKNINLFINARTDTYLLGLPAALEETLTRIKAYEEAGASGIFVPCITDANDIRTVVKATSLPINVLARPNLTSVDDLAALGVRRLSMGNAVYDKLTDVLNSTMAAALEKRSLSAIF